jgi:ABC-type antimicrobial peptide transport system permease subunit
VVPVPTQMSPPGGIGALAGVLPAIRAARLSPTQALLTA